MTLQCVKTIRIISILVLLFSIVIMGFSLFGSVSQALVDYDFRPYGPDEVNPGAETYPTDRYPHAGTIGGGTGTGVTPPRDACVVRHLSASTPYANARRFVECIENVSEGGWIWIENNVIIDLTEYLQNTGEAVLIEGKSITIASGRSRDDEGALILIQKDARTPRNYAVTVRNAAVRFTGIRMHGAAVERAVDWTAGIHAYGDGAKIIVDNSEFKYWDRAGALVAMNALGIVHHNYFENRYGYGYGVAVSGNRYGGAEAIIEANRFRNNKHGIAGSGWPGDKYTAGWNIVEEPTEEPVHGPDEWFPSHDFDMHGGRDNDDRDDLIAGESVNIYNNTFLNNFSMPIRGNITIRGKPTHRSYIRYNRFRYNNPENAIRQYYDFGNLTVGGNTYAENNSGWYAAFTSGGEVNSWYRIATTNIRMNDIALKDIRGMGKDQIFMADGEQWKVIHFIANEKGGGLYPVWENRIRWDILESNGTRLGDIGFGDFNGDGHTDLLVESDDNWHIRWSRTGDWSYNWNTDKPPVRELRFGDFNGDGVTDVFFIEEHNENGVDMISWKISTGGRSAWQTINSWELGSDDGRKARLENLAFGNFIDNGRTDVFASWNGRWWVNPGGSRSFQRLSTSLARAGELHFADFNGDGITDVFGAWGGYWRVSWGGRSSWTVFGTSGMTIPDLRFGDIDGNGETDIIGRLSAF
jgi:hypothetical protein